MEKKKSNMSVIVLLLCIIIVLLIGIIVFLLFKDTSNNTNTTNNNEVNATSEEVISSEENKNIVEETSQETVYTEDELFDKLKGIYKYVNENGRNYVIRFYKDIYNDNKNTFTYGMYGTDGGIGGEITKVEYLSDSIYRITVYSAGCQEVNGNTCMVETEPETYNIDINISNIDSKKIDIKIDNHNNINCEYVTDNWDEMDKYFSY